MKNFVIFIWLFVLMSSSCTIQKMRYSKGYHIEWAGKGNHSVSSRKIKHQKKLTHFQELQKAETVSAEIAEAAIEKPNIIEPEKNENPEKATPLTSKKKGKATQFKYQENQLFLEKIKTENPEKFTQRFHNQKTEKTQILGIALLLVGLLLGLLGFVFFAILGVFFGPIFLVIFLLGAAICILAGLLSALF